MSFTKDLLVGLKSEIPSGVLAAASIVFGELPSTPDRAAALSAYAAVDEPKVAKSTIRVQFMFRGLVNNSVDCDDLADDVFSLLQGLEDRTYGSVHLIQCFRVSAVPLGIDTSKRSTRADNYEIDVDLPITAGRPF